MKSLKESAATLLNRAVGYRKIKVELLRDSFTYVGGVRQYGVKELEYGRIAARGVCPSSIFQLALSKRLYLPASIDEQQATFNAYLKLFTHHSMKKIMQRGLETNALSSVCPFDSLLIEAFILDREGASPTPLMRLLQLRTLGRSVSEAMREATNGG